MTKCEDAMSEVTPEDLAFRLRSNLLSDGAFIRIEAAEALERLTAELAERDALKAAKWDVKHTDKMNDLVQMGMARDAAEASAREAWKALETIRDYGPHSLTRDVLELQATATIALRAKVGV